MGEVVQILVAVAGISLTTALVLALFLYWLHRSEKSKFEPKKCAESDFGLGMINTDRAQLDLFGKMDRHGH